MKNLSLLLILILYSLVSQGQDKPYLIPESLLFPQNNCNPNTEYVEELMKKVEDWGYQTNNNFYDDHVELIDINKDGVCEYLLKYYDGGSSIIDAIYLVQDNELREIGSFWEDSYHWLKNEKSEFPLLYFSYYDGHKTNPIWKFKILNFDGERYNSFYSPDLTYGGSKDEGLKEYRNKNYSVAEIYFRNVLTAFGETPSDINNLAITYIKQKKFDEAERLLLSYLKKNKTADSFYNLSLVYRNKNNFHKELDCLIESNKLKSAKFKTNRINELKKNSR